MPRIVGTAIRFPDHYYPQKSISESLQEIWAGDGVNPALVEKLHDATTVEGRYLAVPKDTYYDMRGWEEPNAIFRERAVELGEEALTEALSLAGVGAEDVRLLAFASTTGVAVPSIDARLMNRMPFRSDTKRMPFYGLGCAAGAAGVARVADYLRGHPDEVAVLVCAEFCSLTIQKHDVSVANIIACGLFGDGVAAVVMTGAQSEGESLSEGPTVFASRSIFFPDTEHYMGWDVKESGMQIILSADVPRAASTGLHDPLVQFLGEHGLTIGDIGQWLCHPGGPKVIDAVEAALGFNGAVLKRSRDLLRESGNISSVSVLVILDQVLRNDEVPRGTWGVMMAMGPGFSAELVLLRW